MTYKTSLVIFVGCSWLSNGAFAQCRSGAEARIEVKRIEATSVQPSVEVSSTGARFIIESKSNHINIIIPDSSAKTIRDFTFMYSKCLVSVIIKKVALETEYVSNLFPLSGEDGFTAYLALSIPKNEYTLERLKQVVGDEKSITLRVK